jgi:PPOX class probable F420-dependent enzyme
MCTYRVYRRRSIIEDMTLDDKTRQLVDGRNFGVVATINSDGSPQTSVIWVGHDGDAVVFSARADRKKTRNLLRDPRVSLTVINAANPYQTVELRGTAEVIDDPERSLSFQLSHKYAGEDPPPEPPEVKRVIVRIVPEKIIHFSA